MANYESVKKRIIKENSVLSANVDRVPKDMSYEYLNKVFFSLFGVPVYDVYIDRGIFQTESVILSDFSDNGFFWAQNENEMRANEYEKLYETMNRICGEEPNVPKADLKSKACIAKFENEWFRAYIDQLLDNGRIRVFFVDYGTSAVVSHNDTRSLDLPEIWSIPPLSIPMVLKGLRADKVEQLKMHQYSTFNVGSIKLIEKSCVFEVELFNEENVNLLDLLE